MWAAVKCLVAVGSSNVDLIKSHARYSLFHRACKYQMCLTFLSRYKYLQEPSQAGVMDDKPARSFLQQCVYTWSHAELCLHAAGGS